MSVPKFEKSYNFMCSYPDLESANSMQESLPNQLPVFDSFLTVKRSSRRDSIVKFTTRNYSKIIKMAVAFWFILCAALFTSCIVLQYDSLKCEDCQSPSALDTLIILSYIAAGFFVASVIAFFVHKLKNK